MPEHDHSFTENVTVFFPNAGKTENMPEFNFYKF